VDGEGVRTAGGLGREVDGERAEVVGFGGGVLVAEVDGDVGTGSVPAPDVDGAIALEDGVIGKHVGEAKLARGLRVGAESAEEKHEGEKRAR
jgi:hypothetical protein